MSEGRKELKKTLGVKEIITLAFGAIIGGGWVMMADSWIATSGAVGITIAFAVAAVVCIFIGLTYAELTPAMPVAGGEYVYAYRAMGMKGGFITAWALMLTYIGICCWVGYAFAKALNNIIPLPTLGTIWEIQGTPVYLSWILISIVGNILISYMNHRGMQGSAKFQNICTLLLAVIGSVLIFGGFLTGTVRNYDPPITNGNAVFLVILAMPAMYAGFNVIPQAAEEADIPQRKIGSLILQTIVVVGIWYCLIMLANGFLASPGRYAEGFGGIGVISALEVVSGSALLARTVLLGVIFGLATTWNGFIIGASRLMYSMARAKMLPDVFAKLHPKYETPTAAIIFICIIGCFTPLVGNHILGWFLNAESLALVVAYISITASFLVLRKKEPDMPRPFVVKNGMAIGVISLLLSIVFFVLYFPVLPGGGLVWQEWVVVGIWCAAGFVMYKINQSQHGDVTLAEREYLIYGEKYGRKEILGGYIPKVSVSEEIRPDSA